MTQSPAPAFVLPDGPLRSMDAFVASGGGRGLEAALELGSDATIATIERAGLRGRGGAGFPTARKWRSVRDNGSGQRFVVVNAAEGEPATFKDRLLIRRDPFRVIEGAAIAAVAVGAGTIYLATKRSYAREVEALRDAAIEFTGSGLLQQLSVNIVEGPDDYLYGEEKALLEVIEGRDALPRLLPPYELGLFASDSPIGWESGSRPVAGRSESNPTVVNNAETLATAAHIMANGADWFRTMGTTGSPGTIIASVVGDVVRPGVHEVEMGTPFAELLARCGGPLPGRRWKAAFSGVSNAVLAADAFDTPLTYEDFSAAGSGLGAAGFAVYDDSANMTSVALAMSRFLATESCGQCPPCKQGSLAITDHLAAICDGRADDSVLGAIERLLGSVTDANRCYLGTEEQTVVSSVLRAFPGDVLALLGGPVSGLRRIDIPIVAELDDEGQLISP
ncbi:MAG: SLBB domain-containing protein [Actinobacteria bacterium]|nr:SLBB domain-containing protein [Actinomycetota bacterium]